MAYEMVHFMGGRSTVGTREGAHIPVPFDVLQEFSASQKTIRRKKNALQRRNTAKAFGAHLRAMREKAKMTQEELAGKIKSSRWTIMRLE